MRVPAALLLFAASAFGQSFSDWENVGWDDVYCLSSFTATTAWPDANQEYPANMLGVFRNEGSHNIDFTFETRFGEAALHIKNYAPGVAKPDNTYSAGFLRVQRQHSTGSTYTRGSGGRMGEYVGDCTDIHGNAMSDPGDILTAEDGDALALWFRRSFSHRSFRTRVDGDLGWYNTEPTGATSTDQGDHMYHHMAGYFPQKTPIMMVVWPGFASNNTSGAQHVYDQPQFGDNVAGGTSLFKNGDDSSRTLTTSGTSYTFSGSGTVKSADDDVALAVGDIIAVNGSTQTGGLTGEIHARKIATVSTGTTGTLEHAFEDDVSATSLWGAQTLSTYFNDSGQIRETTRMYINGPMMYDYDGTAFELDFWQWFLLDENSPPCDELAPTVAPASSSNPGNMRYCRNWLIQAAVGCDPNVTPTDTTTCGPFAVLTGQIVHAASVEVRAFADTLPGVDNGTWATATSLGTATLSEDTFGYYDEDGTSYPNQDIIRGAAISNPDRLVFFICREVSGGYTHCATDCAAATVSDANFPDPSTCERVIWDPTSTMAASPSVADMMANPLKMPGPVYMVGEDSTDHRVTGSNTGKATEDEPAFIGDALSGADSNASTGHAGTIVRSGIARIPVGKHGLKTGWTGEYWDNGGASADAPWWVLGEMTDTAITAIDLCPTGETYKNAIISASNVIHGNVMYYCSDSSRNRWAVDANGGQVPASELWPSLQITGDNVTLFNVILRDVELFISHNADNWKLDTVISLNAGNVNAESEAGPAFYFQNNDRNEPAIAHNLIAYRPANRCYNFFSSGVNMSGLRLTDSTCINPGGVFTGEGETNGTRGFYFETGTGDPSSILIDGYNAYHILNDGTTIDGNAALSGGGSTATLHALTIRDFWSYAASAGVNLGRVSSVEVSGSRFMVPDDSNGAEFALRIREGATGTVPASDERRWFTGSGNQVYTDSARTDVCIISDQAGSALVAGCGDTGTSDMDAQWDGSGSSNFFAADDSGLPTDFTIRYSQSKAMLGACKIDIWNFNSSTTADLDLRECGFDPYDSWDLAIYDIENMVATVDSNTLTTLTTVDDWRPGDTVTITIPTSASSVMEYAGNVYPNRQNAPGTITTSGTSITFNDNDCDTWGLGVGDLIGLDETASANDEYRALSTTLSGTGPCTATLASAFTMNYTNFDEGWGYFKAGTGSRVALNHTPATFTTLLVYRSRTSTIHYNSTSSGSAVERPFCGNGPILPSTCYMYSYWEPAMQGRHQKMPPYQIQPDDDFALSPTYLNEHSYVRIIGAMETMPAVALDALGGNDGSGRLTGQGTLGGGTTVDVRVPAHPVHTHARITYWGDPIQVDSITPGSTTQTSTARTSCSGGCVITLGSGADPDPRDQSITFYQIERGDASTTHQTEPVRRLMVNPL